MWEETEIKCSIIEFTLMQAPNGCFYVSLILMLCNVCVVVNIVVILQVKLMQNANNKNKLSKHGLVFYLKSKVCFVSYCFIFT